MSSTIKAGTHPAVAAMNAQIGYVELCRTSAELRRIGRRIWLAHLESKTDAELRGGVPAIAEVELMWDLADRLDRVADDIRPVSQRERETSLPKWLPGICERVVRRFQGARA